ncbi:MAG: energy transducer TonB [Gemmatimonadaceae bacterium]|nr:energy transducer TonB [Gemmatimonadaceae bacterium]
MSRSVIGTLRLFAALAFVSLPSMVWGQEEQIYNPSELDSPPRLSSQEMTARLLARSYPADLQKSGVTGIVQVQFVVDKTGKVDPNSIKIVSSTVPQLADAAKKVVEEIKFRPGQVKGQAVKSMVLLPIVYK